MTVKKEPANISKQTVIQAYFPRLKYPSAKRKFARWVNQNPRLLKELKKRNYIIFQKTLTRKQLKVILRFLGRPESDIFFK